MMSGPTVERIGDFVARHVEGEASVADRCRAAFDDYFAALEDAFRTSDEFPEDCQQLRETIDVRKHVSCGHIYNEFHINLELKPRNDFVAPTKSTHRGYVEIKLLPRMVFSQGYVSASNADLRLWDYYKQWCNESMHISCCKFRNWAVALVDKFEIVNGVSNFYVVREKTRRPIYSKIIRKLGTDVEFKVNFSFCLSFNTWRFDDWQGERWNAIADPSEFKMPNKVHLWRYSFPNLETATLQRTSHSKNILGMIMCIRNNYKIYYFMDYIIANICMDEKFDSAFWNRDIYMILKTTLREIMRVLEEGKLPYHFDNTVDLLGDWNANAMNDAKNCFKHVSDVLDRVHVFEQFGKSLTQKYFDNVMLNRCKTPYSNNNISNNNNTTAALSANRENVHSNLNNNHQQPQNNNRQDVQNNGNSSNTNININCFEQLNSFEQSTRTPNTSNQLDSQNNIGSTSTSNSGQSNSSGGRQSTPPQNNNQGRVSQPSVLNNTQSAATQSNQQRTGVLNNGNGTNTGTNNFRQSNPSNSRQNNQQNIRSPNRPNPPNSRGWIENDPYRMNNQNRANAQLQQNEEVSWEQIGTGVAIAGAVVAGLFGLKSLWGNQRN